MTPDWHADIVCGVAGEGSDGAASAAIAVPSVGILVVAYEAQDTIAEVLGRMPTTVTGVTPRVLVADDASLDDTAALAHAWQADIDPTGARVEVVRRARNLGYGGNQKAGYRWAIDRGTDVVALLHGDAQYRPELIESLVGPIVAGHADAVIGSRMSTPGGARAGGMPWMRRAGNRVLSVAQNRLTGESFTEWHSGMRAYRTSALATLELDRLPDGFDFDTALMLELLGAGATWTEVPIPTRYGEERSRVQLFRFGLQVLRRTVAYRLAQRALVRRRR